MKNYSRLLMCLFLCLCLLCGTLLAAAEVSGIGSDAQPGFSIGDTVAGFTVVKNGLPVEDMGYLYMFEHEKSGAQVMYFANDDPNKYIVTAFRTLPDSNKGIPNILHKAILDGSEKYPSKTLSSSLGNATFNTDFFSDFDNVITFYVAGSYSEEQLQNLLDYYVSSALHPLVLTDRRIFDEEAWHYALNSPEDELTIQGAVYDSLDWACGPYHDGYYNMLGELFPESSFGYDSEGCKEDIQDLTWDELREYHAKYYTPGNSIVCMYGSYADPAAFLELLNSYYVDYDKDTVKPEEPVYAHITEPVVKEFTCAADPEDDAKCWNCVNYGFVCDGLSVEQRFLMGYLADILSFPSSVYSQNFFSAFPDAFTFVYYDDYKPEPVFCFNATGVKPEDAEAFRDVVVTSLKQFIEEDIDLGPLDALENYFGFFADLEDSDDCVFYPIYCKFLTDWGICGKIRDDSVAFHSEMDYADQIKNRGTDVTFRDLVQEYFLDSPQNALITTIADTALLDSKESAQREKLAKVKSDMADAEIAEIVARTNEPEKEPDDAETYLAQLKITDMASLPENVLSYDVVEEKGQDAVRYLSAEVNTTGKVGQTIYLDAGAIDQELLPYFHLYLDLLGKLDTTHYSSSEISSLITQYLPDFYLSIYVPDVVGEQNDPLIPYAKIDFVTRDDDAEKAFELLYELLFETRFTDMDLLRDCCFEVCEDVWYECSNWAIYSDTDPLTFKAKAHVSPANALLDSISYVNYYEALCDMLTEILETPEVFARKLQDVQNALRNRYGAVSAIAGNSTSIAKGRSAVDSFLMRLDNTPAEHSDYSVDLLTGPVEVDACSLSTTDLYFADSASLGLEKHTAALDVLSHIAMDTCIAPALDGNEYQGIVYHFFDSTGCYIYTTYEGNDAAYDQKIRDTINGLTQVKKAVEAMDEKALEDYTLTAYNYHFRKKDTVFNALDTIARYIEKEDLGSDLAELHELKSMTREQLISACDVYEAFVQNYSVCTSKADPDWLSSFDDDDYDDYYDYADDDFGW